MKKILSITLIILALTAFVLCLCGYGYIFKTLVYNFPNIDDLEIFEKRIVPDSISEPWPISSGYNKKTLGDKIENESLTNESVAVLVVKHDSIIYEHYWDGYDDNSLSNSFSVSKSIVGLLTGIAIDEKLISLNDPVGKYIDFKNQEQNSGLKIIDLLDMSSGLNWDESYQSLFSKTTEAYYGANLQKEIEKLTVVEQPGKIFQYMSCNSLILGMIISKASGKTLSEYASEKLWKRIGASHPAYWSLDHTNGIEKSYCCFYSNARDFARLGKLILDSGKWNGRQIVSSDFIAHSITPNNLKDTEGNTVDYYGWQWWITEIDGRKIYYARGILGQYIITIPEEDMIVVRLGKKRGEKNTNNQYSEMVSYTHGAIETFGN